jgi:hypothetical protein
MGGKPRPKGMLAKACRYNDRDVAIYTMGTNPDKSPHDYVMFYTGSEWRKMGGKIPPLSTVHKGHVLVRLVVEEVSTEGSCMDVTITISGPIDSGKTTIARLLHQALAEHDINTIVTDEGVTATKPTEEDLSPYLRAVSDKKAIINIKVFHNGR